MLNIPKILQSELQISEANTQNILQMLHEKATVPFMARYRKDMTGNLDEVKLRAFVDRFSYLAHLQERKETVLKTIEEQGKLTPDLRQKIEACLLNTELEDLYLPFKPKRRTRAMVAKERGLEDLAVKIRALTDGSFDLEALAVPFVCREREVFDVKEALAGAADILAEEISEQSHHRDFIRKYLWDNGVFVSRARREYEGKKTKFEMYYTYEAKVSEISSHNLLAILRGEEEGVLTMQLVAEKEPVFEYLKRGEIRVPAGPIWDYWVALIQDAYERLMRVSLSADVRVAAKEKADGVAIQAFETNLRNLLLTAPAGMRPVLGVDPGFVTGCKVAAVDSTGKFLEYQTIYPNPPQNETAKAMAVVESMCRKHRIELIAIGNGTASRETEGFIQSFLDQNKGKIDPMPVKVVVSEAGASIYSASPVAAEEFPDQDVTVRGAISIARRLQDPLAELVKLDPKSIGVGQYQHDVDQKLLKKKLEDVVESCVNYVGVDLNLASKELLSRVSGINSRIARMMVEYRNTNGAFTRRQDLLKIATFGEKTFEQAAGFLRIRDARYLLDNTAIHPESYPIVERMCADLAVPLESVVRQPDLLNGLKAQDYVSGPAGELTVRDILTELKKPTRDPRSKFRYARFEDSVREMKDLQPGMKLEGVVTNVTRFGAFVDIGVHQDGLVHISQIADTFVRDPAEHVKVGDIVRVTVLDIDLDLKRVSLSLRKRPQAASK